MFKNMIDFYNTCFTSIKNFLISQSDTLISGTMITLISTMLIGIITYSYHQRIKKFFKNYYHFIMNNRYVSVNENEKTNVFMIPKKNFDLYPEGYDETPIQSVIKKLGDKDKTRRHIIIEAEGGMGKTVTLLKIYQGLRNKKKLFAIYLPLYELVLDEKEITFEEFIKSSIFNDEDIFYKSFIKKIKKKNRRRDQKPSLIILLDGFNEVAMAKRDFIANNIKQWVKYNKVQLIITTRGKSLSGYGMDHCFHKIQIKKLTVFQIEDYLKVCHVPFPENNRRLLDVLGNPLMLTLYAHTESFYQRYSKEIYNNLKIAMWKDSCDNAGSIIWNYFQCQIIKFFDIGRSNQNKLDSIVYIEYLLPYICFEMIKIEIMEFDFSYFMKIIDNADNLFKKNWIAGKPERIRMAETSLDCKWRMEGVEGLLVHDIHILDIKEKNNKISYKLFHQNIRDCSAAIYLVNAMDNCMSPEALFNLWNGQDFPEYLIQYTADLLNNKKLSHVLDIIKNYDDNRTALNNILCVMRLKNENDLSQFDLSRCDLSTINLQSCIFSTKENKTNFSKSRIGDITFIPDSNFLKARAIIPRGKDFIIISDDGSIRLTNSFLQCVHTFKIPDIWIAGVYNYNIFYVWHNDEIILINLEKNQIISLIKDSRIICFMVSEAGIAMIINNQEIMWFNMNLIDFSKNIELDKLIFAKKSLKERILSVAYQNNDFMIVLTDKILYFRLSINKVEINKTIDTTLEFEDDLICFPSGKEREFYIYSRKQLYVCTPNFFNLLHTDVYFYNNYTFSKCGRYLANYGGCTIRLYSIKNGFFKYYKHEMKENIKIVKWIGRSCYCLLANHELYVLDDNNRNLFFQDVAQFCFNEESKDILISCEDGSLFLIDESKVIRSNISFITVKDNYCYAISLKKSLIIWDLKSGQIVTEFIHPQYGIERYAFSKFNNNCIICLSNGIAQLWDFTILSYPELLKTKIFSYHAPILLISYVPLFSYKDCFLIAFKNSMIECRNTKDNYLEKRFYFKKNSLRDFGFFDSSSFYCISSNEIIYYNFHESVPRTCYIDMSENISVYSHDIYATLNPECITIFNKERIIRLDIFNYRFPIRCIAFMKNKNLICADTKGDLIIFDINKEIIKQPDMFIEGDGTLITKILPLSSYSRCICVTADGSLKFWDLQKNKAFLSSIIQPKIDGCTFVDADFESEKLKNLVIRYGGII